MESRRYSSGLSEKVPLQCQCSLGFFSKHVSRFSCTSVHSMSLISRLHGSLVGSDNTQKFRGTFGFYHKEIQPRNSPGDCDILTARITIIMTITPSTDKNTQQFFPDSLAIKLDQLYLRGKSTTFQDYYRLIYNSARDTNNIGKSKAKSNNHNLMNGNSPAFSAKFHQYDLQHLHLRG